jgi:hypothetical protein
LLNSSSNAGTVFISLGLVTACGFGFVFAVAVAGMGLRMAADERSALDNDSSRAKATGMI